MHTETVTINENIKDKSIPECLQKGMNFLPNEPGAFSEVTDERIASHTEVYKETLSEILD